MLIIAERQLNSLIEKLKTEFDFFDVNPVRDRSSQTTDGLQGSPVSNGIHSDPLPFKKYFFPPTQEIFYIDKKNRIKTANPVRDRSLQTTGGFQGNPVSNGTGSPTKDFILFGLPLPALEALTYLDEIMKKPASPAGGHDEDFFYFQKRNKAIIIGLTDEEFDAAPGGDVVFQNVHIVGGQQEGNIYRVVVNTRKGNNLILKNRDFFEEIDEKKIKIEVPKGNPLDPKGFPFGNGDWSKSMRELLVDSELLKEAVEWSRDNHPIWEELRKQCLGCGICTYVCPLCHCFSIEDRVGLDDKCSRCRKWDACTLPGFARISGGHNFRPTIKERYYNWFYHKFVRAYLEYGKPQCVGCGRCKKYCPAKIDIQEVLSVILRDYRSSQ